MDNKEQLKELLVEQVKDIVGSDIDTLKEKAAAQEELNAKTLEENSELKAKLDSMQDKKFTAAEKLGGATFIFKGYNPDMSKNFRSTLSEDEADQVAKAFISQRGEVWKAFDAASAIPVQYGTALMGLAELSSVALTHANVMNIEAPVMKLPVKGTRGAVNAQASATANTEDTPTLGQITWTIDKRIGNYVEVLNDQLEDATFDIVNQYIVPMQAEAIGQHIDDEVFNSGGEFTSSIADVTPVVTTSGVVGTAAAITFANLNTMFYGVEWERGNLNPKWYGSRAALKDIAALVDTTGKPLFQQVPINGRPSQTLMGAEYVVTPVIANAPGVNCVRLVFGDMRYYTIVLRGGRFVSMINPYVKMKEDVTQIICKVRADGNVADVATPANSTVFANMERTA